MLEMKVYVALGAYIGTWIVLVFLIVYFVRRSRPNAYHFVDPKIIAQTKRELNTGRIARHNEFIATELAELRRGKKLPVLDVWKFDTQMIHRNSYFSRIVHIALDPQKKEMELLIRLPAIKTAGAEELYFSKVQLYSRIGDFLIHSAADPRLDAYKEFFTVMYIECDVLREDERGYDIPVPVFSMELPAERLWELTAFTQYQQVALDRIADIRFLEGGRIEPHRIMIT